MITVFGSINLDQIGTVPHLPGAGETVLGDSFSVAPGGKGANQALAAARAGAQVRLFGAVGADPFAEPATRLLSASGMDLSGVRRTSGATGIAMILVDSAGENAIAVLPGANAALTPQDGDAALEGMERGDVLLLQQEIAHDANVRALHQARRLGVTSILNTAPFLATTPDLAENADIVIANESEFALLHGGAMADLDAAIIGRAAARGQTVIVTLGAEGVRAASPGSAVSVPAMPITPLDTVGAGDTFCGYLAAGLDAGLGLEAALERATAAASLACLAPGAQPSIPEAADVDKAMAAPAQG